MERANSCEAVAACRNQKLLVHKSVRQLSRTERGGVVVVVVGEGAIWASGSFSGGPEPASYNG